jgi:hypothetical protein
MAKLKRAPKKIFLISRPLNPNQNDSCEEYLAWPEFSLKPNKNNQPGLRAQN